MATAPAPPASETKPARAVDDRTQGPGPNGPSSSARATTTLLTSPAGFALFAALAAFFVYLSRRPLWHTDLWGHLAYGRLIVGASAIPSSEPLMPLSEGMRFVDFSWLSEILSYFTYEWRGAPALQFLYAGSVTLCVDLLAWCSLRKTGSVWAAATAAAIYVCVDWQQFSIVRPQLAGCVCFVMLFAVAIAPISRLAGAVAVTTLFAAWANLHGSFLIGLATLAAFVCGRAGDLLRRTRSLRAVQDDRRMRGGIVLLILAGAAVMLNPYGWRVYQAAWQLSSNANLADLVEWQPLRLWMWQGRAALALSLGLLGLYALTPRRISTTELLLLVGFGVAALRASRMIVWWGPVAAYYASLHAAAIWKRWRRGGRSQLAALPWRVPPLLLLATVCAALAFTPLAREFLDRALSDPPGSFSAETPVGAAEFLKEYGPRGQIFNTLEWGDYLLWAGPPRLKVFVASHVHLVPRAVWEDYIRIITLDEGWQKILERYRINTAIVDDDQHAALADALREDRAWTVAYEDPLGAVVVRRHPL